MCRRTSIVSVVAAVLAVSGVGTSAGAVAEPRANAMQQLQAGVFAELNATRQQHGLTPLRSSPDVDPGGALHMWMNSPEHRANILNARWRQIGISAVHVDAAPGMFGGDPVTVITTDFGVRR